MKNWISASTMAIAAASLASCGGESSNSNNAAVTSNALQPLSVNVGADKAASERETVSVSASVSGSDNGVAYEWTQLSGPMANLQGSDDLALSFRAPNVRRDETISLRLTARDGSRTASDDLNVTIRNVTDGPVGPSPQGIPNDGRNRRNDARNNRENRMMIDNREVRTYDGFGNNIDNPNWGSTFIHLQRLGDSAYSDGVSSLAGSNRLSARAVSNAVISQTVGESIPNPVSGSDFVWQWGQFLDHDIDLTDGAEETADILVPSGDPSFDPASTGSVMIPFSRALFDPTTGVGTDNPREQENEITSWIDGSMVYGSSDDRMAELRVGPDSPLLKTSDGNLLPFNEKGLTNANGFITDPAQLFLAGDIRANEQLALATMHTLWVREHNRVARRLANEIPSATPGEIFEQTRRLIISKIQIITYEEWLPILLGENAIPAYSGYDPTINPSIYNEFSAAAFRLGHSMLNESLLRLDSAGAEIEGGHIPLASAFFTAPTILTSEDSLDPILRGLAAQRHQALDEKIVDDLRNFLFGAPGDGGLDLASLNIQRGRDHGLPDYNRMRNVMGLPRITQFADISANADTVAALSATFDTVDDIDLWVGGLAEDAAPGSQLGPLFQAIMVRQFSDLRDGDRFWYQNDLNPMEMSRVQGTTLARIIRDNTNIGNELQDNVFIVP